LFPSLNSCLYTKKIQLLGSDDTGSNQPIRVLESDNKGQVQAREIEGGGTKPGEELGNGKIPIRRAIKGEHALALCRRVC